MSYKLSDVVYEDNQYWVLKVPHGFDVYKVGVTHSSRVSRIGYKGDIGLDRAKMEIERRKNNQQ